MTVDCRKYLEALTKSKKTIQILLDRYEDKDRAVTEFAVVSGIPILVVCVYLTENFPPHPQIQESMKRMIDFYKYTKVIHFDGTETIHDTM